MLTGFRDTDLLIMNQLNDRDLLSYCQTDKIGVCKNEDFWRNRFIKIHGEEAAKFKNKDRSWKDYYLAVIYYREKYTDSKAVEEAARKDHMDLFLFFSQFLKDRERVIAAISSENIKYINLIKNMDIDQQAANWGLLYAAKHNDEELIRFFLKKGARSDIIYIGYLQGKNKENTKIARTHVEVNDGLSAAVRGRNLKLIKYFIKKGADDWNAALNSAVTIGDIDLIKLFISKGTKRWNDGLFGAAQSGNKELIDFFVDKGARDFSTALYMAVAGGYKDIIKYIEKLQIIQELKEYKIYMKVYLRIK